MTNTADSDPDLGFSSSPNFILTNFPSSASNPSPGYHQNPRKKRSRFLKVDSGTSSVDSRPVSRPKYSKKPDPGAPKITRPCSECGKKFWSWKALFGHMRCHPERQWRGINPPPNYRRPISPVKQVAEDFGTLVTMTEEDQEIAACLLMLSNGGADVAGEMECGTSYPHGVEENDALGANSSHVSCRFECSSCKKVFGSHQALGGHRASHKNVKGCFAITRSGDCSEVEDGTCGDIGDGVMNENNNGEDNSKMMMVLGHHKCSICLRVFSSGQALGGHMRCHWERGDEPLLNHGLNPFASKEISYGGLDLNLPAPVEADSSSSPSSSFFLDLRLGL